MAATTLMTGCVSPVVIGPDYAGVGLLSQDCRSWESGARYDEVRGFGALAMDGALRIGFVRVQRMVCPLEEGASYRARAPMGEVAVGDEAGVAAAELAAAWNEASVTLRRGADGSEEAP